MLGETAKFSCSANYVNDIIFEVSLGDATIDRSNWASRGISQSPLIPSGDTTTVDLTVRGDVDNNGTEVHCSVLYVGSFVLVSIPPPAKLTVQG